MIDPDWGHGGLFGHGGDGPGFNTWAMHLPDFHGRPVTLVAFCNTTMGGHPVNLVRDMLRVLRATGGHE
jgi:D-alanyl-D-alanine carboxypeptidase